MPSEIRLSPVGSIEVKDGRIYLSIQEKFRPALKELDGFSHIHILWWGNQTDTPEQRETLLSNKPYKKSPDTLGIFSTRSPVRPNPVLITIAAIISIDIKKGIIELPWIDTDAGTPVIDIKPYHPCSDRVKNVKLPYWCAEWPQCYEESATFDWAKVFN